MVNGLVERFPDLRTLPGEVGAEADRPGIVHRLDRGTSGLMVVARTPDCLPIARRPAGEPERDPHLPGARARERRGGVGDGRRPDRHGRSTHRPGWPFTREGKEARTRYRVEGRFSRPAPTTLMTASLETGRTHQIRVHLSAIGHPVVGDEVYGHGRTSPGAVLPGLSCTPNRWPRPPGYRGADVVDLDVARRPRPSSWTSCRNH